MDLGEAETRALINEIGHDAESVNLLESWLDTNRAGWREHFAEQDAGGGSGRAGNGSARDPAAEAYAVLGLEPGASDEEIERLVEELRQAMNDYLTALAQSGQPMEEASQNAQQLDQSDLDDMLDSIRDLSQQGANNAARQMLSDLENMLNNLRLSQVGAGQNGEGQSGQGQSGQGERGGAAGVSAGVGRSKILYSTPRPPAPRLDVSARRSRRSRSSS